MASRQDFLDFINKPRQVRAVPIPELGIAHVRMMNVYERLQLEKRLEDDKADFALHCIAIGLCDDKGESLIPDGNLQHAGAFSLESATKIADAFADLNQLLKGHIDDLAKNSIPPKD